MSVFRAIDRFAHCKRVLCGGKNGDGGAEESDEARERVDLRHASDSK